MESKQQMRKYIQTLLSELDGTQFIEKSFLLQQKIIVSSDFYSAKSLAIFIAFQYEPDTRLIIETAWKQGKRVYIPKVEGENMHFYEILSWNNVEEGSFGITEPKGKCQLLTEKIDVIYVPGIAFTRIGKRLGRGKGYYDRFLAQNKDLIGKKVGLCFAEQIVDDFETEAWDVIMDEVVY